MTHKQLEILTNEIKEIFQDKGADHDWFHINRVLKISEYIQSQDGGNLKLIQALALLHDISDHKLNGGIKNDNARAAEILLKKIGVPSDFCEKVVQLVDKISFKGAGVADENGPIELQVVRDADRLDAMGAIGIARAFHFGGRNNRSFYIPNTEPKHHTSFEDYAVDQSHTINHFYEKLLLLQDRLQTPTGKKLGEQRHQLMLQFVKQFENEWEVNCY